MVCTFNERRQSCMQQLEILYWLFFFPVLEVQYLLEKKFTVLSLLRSAPSKQLAGSPKKRARNSPNPFLRWHFSYLTTTLQSSFSCERFSQSFWWKLRPCLHWHLPKSECVHKAAPQALEPPLYSVSSPSRELLNSVVTWMYGFILRVLGAMSAELCCRSRVWFVSFYTVKCQGPAGPALPQAEGAPWWTHRGEGVDHWNTPKLLLNTKKKPKTKKQTEPTLIYKTQPPFLGQVLHWWYPSNARAPTAKRCLKPHQGCFICKENLSELPWRKA